MIPRAIGFSFLGSAILALAACSDPEVASYRVPKEKETPPFAPTPAPRGMTGPVAAVDGAAALEWQAPAAWTAKPASAARKATYQVGANGDLSVTAFPGDVGGEFANVNRWREQVQLAPLAAADLAPAITRLDTNGLKIAVVDFAGGGQRILGAIVPVAQETWFFKLQGPDAAIAAEKNAFLDFVKTVKPAAK